MSEFTGRDATQKDESASQSSIDQEKEKRLDYDIAKAEAKLRQYQSNTPKQVFTNISLVGILVAIAVALTVFYTGAVAKNAQPFAKNPIVVISISVAFGLLTAGFLYLYRQINVSNAISSAQEELDDLKARKEILYRVAPSRGDSAEPLRQSPHQQGEQMPREAQIEDDDKVAKKIEKKAESEGEVDLPMMTRLSGQQKEQLQQAIVDAFDQEELKELLDFRLDLKLDHIAPGAGFDTVVFDVIQKAEREGWTADLLRAIAAKRPNRPDLRSLVARLLTVLEGG